MNRAGPAAERNQRQGRVYEPARHVSEATENRGGWWTFRAAGAAVRREVSTPRLRVLLLLLLYDVPCERARVCDSVGARHYWRPSEFRRIFEMEPV